MPMRKRQQVGGSSHAWRRVAAALVVLAFFTPLARATHVVAEPSLASATTMVKAMYRWHFAHRQRWDLTFARHRSRFAAPLLAAFAAEDRWCAAHPDEVGNLDGDALTNSQEMATGYAVGAAARDGSAGAVVPVTVRIAPETRAVRVRLVVERGIWRIADIEYGDGPSLKAILEMPHV